MDLFNSQFQQNREGEIEGSNLCSKYKYMGNIADKATTVSVIVL